MFLVHSHLTHITNLSLLAVLARFIDIRNDIYCVGWGVKLYSLTKGEWGHPV